MRETSPISTSTEQTTSDSKDDDNNTTAFILIATGVVMMIVILFSFVVFIVKRRKLGNLEIWNTNEQNMIGNDCQDPKRYTSVTVRPYLEYCAIMPPPLKDDTTRAEQEKTSNRTDLMEDQQDRQEYLINGGAVSNNPIGISSDGCSTVESRPKHIKIKPYLEYCAIVPPPHKNPNLYSGDV